MGKGGLFLRKLRARVADKPTGFVWVEKGKLAGSGYPASRSQVEWVAKAGIKSILTLTKDPLPVGFTERLDLMCGHVPMADHEPPSFEAMGRAVEFLANNVRSGRPVLVHCLAGEGRTGCAIAAYLIKTEGLGADEAMAKIREAKSEFVEWRQEPAVRDYAARIGS